MRSLLDVNVLLALLDSDHSDHQRAMEWLESEIGRGWASCAITENGFVRIISQPRYPSPIPPKQAVERLRKATETEYHVFWDSDLSFLDGQAIRADRIHGPRQVTDVYLLALAVRHRGRFVTFDRSIPLQAVTGAETENLVLL